MLKQLSWNQCIILWVPYILQLGWEMFLCVMQQVLPSRRTPRWPFFVFLGGAMFCLLASAMCHLFFCHSPWTSYYLLQIDYAGIVGLIVSSFYPPVSMCTMISVLLDSKCVLKKSILAFFGFIYSAILQLLIDIADMVLVQHMPPRSPRWFERWLEFGLQVFRMT